MRNRSGLRFIGAVLLVAVLSMQAACGRDEGMTLTEYAEEVEELIAAMNARLDALDEELAATPTLEVIKRNTRERVAARVDFVGAIETLDPPAEARDLHEVALRLVDKMIAAESHLSDRVQTLETVADFESIWLTPEGVAASAADQEVIDLCFAAQSAFDETQNRAEFEDIPWVPPEMKEVILVTFGCTSEIR